MVRCDNCDTDVQAVWRHRERAEAMTHREVTWCCRDCHGGVHSPVEHVDPGRRVVTDYTPEAAAD